jgi:hypothetical protein
LVFLSVPVEIVVLLEALTDKEIIKDLSEVRVVGLVIGTKTAGIIEVGGELWTKLCT